MAITGNVRHINTAKIDCHTTRFFFQKLWCFETDETDETVKRLIYLIINRLPIVIFCKMKQNRNSKQKEAEVSSLQRSGLS
jgi:hypothetical protein